MAKTKITPSLEERGLTTKEILQKAQKINNDEFYHVALDTENKLVLEVVNGRKHGIVGAKNGKASEKQVSAIGNE